MALQSFRGGNLPGYRILVNRNGGVGVGPGAHRVIGSASGFSGFGLDYGSSSGNFNLDGISGNRNSALNRFDCECFMRCEFVAKCDHKSVRQSVNYEVSV